MPLKEKIRIDDIKKDKPLLRRAIKSLFYFIIGVAMSTGSVMDGLKPFGQKIFSVFCGRVDSRLFNRRYRRTIGALHSRSGDCNNRCVCSRSF